ncbi:hypothetical protein [Streptomyces sp. NPDC056480]|uniref:hypothetical protein n=1 Tax=Streptomyces sp. NPDC056480 TaxID=3345833 RepID=UPI0036AA1F63
MAAGGHEVVQDGSADGADQVDGGADDDVCSLDDLVSGGLECAIEKLARSGSVSVVAVVASAMAIRMAW